MSDKEIYENYLASNIYESARKERALSFDTLAKSMGLNGDELERLFFNEIKAHAPATYDYHVAEWKRQFDQKVTNPLLKNDLKSLTLVLSNAWEVVTRNGVPERLEKVTSHISLPSFQRNLASSVGIITDTQQTPMLIAASNLRISEKNLFVFSLLQSGILFLLISLAVFQLYAPTFIGSFKEFLTVFLFTFSIDITVDNLVGIQGQVKMNFNRDLFLILQIALSIVNT